MKKIIQFGEKVEGYNTPVLNEREIRAAAGILFLMISIAALRIDTQSDFLLFKYAITITFADFIIRVFVNPRFSPSLILGRLIVGKQSPEYVGARQKKFAWTIGVALSTTIFILLVAMNTDGLVVRIGCLICLVFLFFETAFGICLGCKFYSLFYKDKAHYCPGEVCDPKPKQAIQKTSKTQVFIVFAFIACIFLAALFFNDQLSKMPDNLFGTDSSGRSE